MANTYTSREARRKAAIADALMQSALAPSQGQMVGRYYVGEGIGGGITRLGQALLGRSLSGKADAQEEEALAEQKQAKLAAFDQFKDAATPHDVTTMEYNGGRKFEAVPKTSKYQPTNQDIAAALMRYQSETGEKVDDSVVKLLAGGSLDGGAEAFGTTIQKDGRTYQLTKSGKLIDLGEGYDQRTRVVDLGGSYQVLPTTGTPTPLATIPKGVSTDLVAKEQQRIREEQRAPEVAAATEAAKARAGAQVEKEESATAATDAMYELSRLDKALMRVPQTKWSQFAEDVVAPLTGGDPEIQAAMGEVSQISGRMLKYVERLPGAATDKDRDVFMASAGVMQNPDATVGARRAAVQSAMDSYKRLVERYGDKGAQPSAPANPADGWSYIGAKQ